MIQSSLKSNISPQTLLQASNHFPTLSQSVIGQSKSELQFRVVFILLTFSFTSNFHVMTFSIIHLLRCFQSR
jgi:hypothetical protein